MSHNALWVTAGILAVLMIAATVLAFKAGENVQQQQELVLKVSDLERAVAILKEENARLRELIASAAGAIRQATELIDQLRQRNLQIQTVAYQPSQQAPWTATTSSTTCVRMSLGTTVEFIICESR